jgi:nitrogen fixation NifU-like protein
LDECLEIKNKDIAAHLKLPPVKLHCSMLAEDAIKAAVKDFQSRNEAHAHSRA